MSRPDLSSDKCLAIIYISVDRYLYLKMLYISWLEENKDYYYYISIDRNEMIGLDWGFIVYFPPPLKGTVSLDGFSF